MSYKPNDPYYAEFTTCDSTGSAVNADSLPVATANHNGTDDAGFVLTVTNIDTGRYKITGTIPNTYAKGDVVSVSIAATISGKTPKAIVDSFVLDSKRVGDLQDPTVGAIAAGVMGDVTDTVGADVVAIKAQTDKLLFDASNFVKSDNQTQVTLTPAEHTNIATDVQSGLTAQGYTTLRAGYLDDLAQALVPATSTVNDAAPTTTSFVTALASATDAFYVGMLLIFTNGSLAGQVRPITGYTGTSKKITLGVALTGTPANGAAFALIVGSALIDAAISSRLATSGYTAPPTTGQIAATVMTDVSDTVGADVVAIKAQTDKLLFDGSSNVKSTPQTDVTVGGYAAGQDPGTLLLATPANKLATDAAGHVILQPAGLDQISVADPGAVTNWTTLPKILVVLFRRFLKKSTLTSTQLETFADDGTTVNSTQTVSDDGTTQTQGAAS